MAWVTGDRESVCREVYAIRERKSCYESGQAVTFLFGDYYCCKNVTDEELVSYGSSAFWRMNRGFCGRGGCETCSRDQDCVVFGGGEDVFCCPHGYITDEEMALRHNARPTEPLRPHEEHDHRGHIEDHDHDNHHIHGNDDSSEEVTDDNIRLKDDGAVDNGFREVVRQPTPRIDPPLDPRRQEEENRKKVKLPPIIPPSPATTLRSRNTTRTSIATSLTTRSTSTTRVPEIHPRHDIPSRIYAPRNSRDEELEEILEHDHHMHDHWVILVNIALTPEVDFVQICRDWPYSNWSSMFSITLHFMNWRQDLRCVYMYFWRRFQKCCKVCYRRRGSRYQRDTSRGSLDKSLQYELKGSLGTMRVSRIRYSN